ncbi:DUF362 domain-containing protein [Candidatus Woesearchaeota archaeon]|nr:DUF362 domain-containing protein [Candidatus Woesearchaeota archaeon]
MIFIDIKEKGKLFNILKEQLKNLFKEGDKVAVKLHMGEPPNPYHLKADMVKKIISILKKLKLKPFLFDSIVIYPGGRDTVEKYKETTRKNGFYEKNIGCPVIISDDYIEVKTENLNVQVCKPLAEATALLVLSHVKGHMCSGFGGAIKNLGMGGVTKKTKADIHGLAEPVFKGECKGCGVCVECCPVEAIKLENKKAVFNYSKCWGCGVCILNCKNNVLKPKKAMFDALLAEGAYAVIKNKRKQFYLNFLQDITKLCDCCSDPEGIVLEDIGMVLSKNIVEADKTSFDLINKKAGKDLFLEIHKKSPLLHIKEMEKLIKC